MLLGGTQATMNLGFNVYLKDNFSGPASKIKNSLDGLKSEFNMYQGNLAAAAATSAAIGTAALGVTRAWGEATMQGAEFLYTMQGVLAISEATTAEFRQLKTLAIDIGRETIFRPDEVASSMRFMAMAGQTAKQILASSAAAIDLGAATMTQPGGKMGSADILTNALKAFGLEAEQSVIMADMLTYATTSANVSLTDLGNSIRYVAATSRNLNIPVQDSIGFLMALGNAGIQSSMAGTALENMYRYLAMSVSDFATKRQISSWAMLGLSKDDVMTAEGAFIPMVDLLRKIKEGSKGLGAVDLQNAIKEIFGVRGQRAAGTLVRNLGQAEGFINQLHSPELHGTARTKSKLMMDSLEGSALRLTSALIGMKAAMADGFSGKIMRVALDGLTGLVKVFTAIARNPVGGAIISFGAILAGVVGIVYTAKAAILGLSLAVYKLKVSMSGMRAAGISSLVDALRFNSTYAQAGGMSMMMGRYSGNRTRFYSTQGGGFVPTSVKPGSRGISPSGLRYGAGPLVLGKGTKNIVSKRGIGGSLGMLGGLGRAGGMLSRLGTFLMGPWGLALMGGITVLGMIMPALIDAIKGNTDSLKAKWDREQVERKKLQGAEVLALLGGHTMGEINAAIKKNLEKAYNRGGITYEQIQELITNNKIDLLYWAFKENLKVDVTASPSDNSDNNSFSFDPNLQ